MVSILDYLKKNLNNISNCNDNQIATSFNTNFKNGSLIETLITIPINNINQKIELITRFSFCEQEITYIRGTIDNLRKIKITSLEILINLASKIENLEKYIDELYVTAFYKQKLYSKIEPLSNEINKVLDSNHSSDLICLRDDLNKILKNKTFKTIELDDLLKKTELELKFSNNQIRKAKKRRKAIFLTSLCICLFSSYKIYEWLQDSYNTNKQMKELKEVIYVPYQENNKYEEHLFSVNFDELDNINSDTIGYIKVNGTNIDYPVVKANNNDYYLYHSFNNEDNNAGWIFMDYRNNVAELSKNTIIYGHGRLDGTMFGSLKNTLNEEWYSNSDNHVLTLVTHNKTFIWQVFSAYKIKKETYYIKTDFNDIKEYKEFIDIIKGRSEYNYNLDVTDSDNILTLSTCYGTDERVVVHAKLIYEK